jgi:hypothetical protein
MAFTFRTKATGIWANFRTDCTCGAELTVTHGRVEAHQCRERKPVTLADIRAALDK